MQHVKDVSKLDDFATNGLLGVPNSLAYRVHELDRHLHGFERWFGLAVTPNGEVHVADRIGPGVSPFQVDAGNNTWSDWLIVLGTSDTPTVADQVYYDLHRLQVTAVERTAVQHFIQLACGCEDPDVSVALGHVSEVVFHPLGQQGQRVPIPIMERRMEVGSRSWLRIMVPGQNTGTMSFYFGLHEYEG